MNTNETKDPIYNKCACMALGIDCAICNPNAYKEQPKDPSHEAFERWFAKPGSFGNPNCFFAGWQASREALAQEAGKTDEELMEIGAQAFQDCQGNVLNSGLARIRAIRQALLPDIAKQQDQLAANQKISKLESALAMAEHNWKATELELKHVREGYQAQLAALQWRPMTQKPTQEDGDKFGNILVLWRNGCIGTCEYTTCDKQMLAWKPIPPYTPPTPEPPDELRVEAGTIPEDFYKGLQDVATGNMTELDVEYVVEGYQAQLAAANKKISELESQLDARIGGNTVVTPWQPISEPPDEKWAAEKAAYAAGKAIQFYKTSEKEWEDCHFPSWLTGVEYRIKPEPEPEPELVPLEAQDVPPGSVFQVCGGELVFPLRITNDYVYFLNKKMTASGWRYAYMFTSKIKISRDGGKTWQPCSKPKGGQP